jgi:ferredoxin
MKRKIIEIDEALCNGCGQCIPGCAEGAIQIINGKAKLIADKHCDGLGHCIGHCPTEALKVVEREAKDFTKASNHKKCGKLACGCSGSHVKVPAQGQLNNWPIQLSLVPVDAPYLQNADLST